MIVNRFNEKFQSLRGNKAIINADATYPLIHTLTQSLFVHYSALMTRSDECVLHSLVPSAAGDFCNRFVRRSEMPAKGFTI